MSTSTAVTRTIIAAIAWLIALGCWFLAFVLWAQFGPNTSLPATIAALTGLLPFSISWFIAARFHAESANSPLHKSTDNNHSPNTC